MPLCLSIDRYTVFDKLILYAKVLGTEIAMKTLCLVPLLLVAVLAQPRHGGHPQPPAEFVASDLGLKAAGLEGHPCIDAAGGLNGCGAAVAIISGLCACVGGYSGDSGDKADL